MNVKKGFIFVSTGIIGGLFLARLIENKMQDYDTDMNYSFIDTVSIIVPTFNEEQFIETTLSSINNQNIIKQFPDKFELILVDSGSTDNTVKLAKPYLDKEKDKIILSPRGKLTAKNIAINQSKGNIIVSVDSDTYYPENWLNTLLRPFSADSEFNNSNKPIIGVVGSTIDYSIKNVPGQVHTIFYSIDRLLNPNQMIGRNSAFYKHAYYLAGGFNENTNQFDITDMVNTEEREFGERLSKFGKIVYRLEAGCIHLGGEKISCRFGLENKNVCNRYGFGIERMRQ